MHRLDGSDRHGIRGLERAQPSPCHDAGHDVLQVVDGGSLVVQLVVVVIKSLIESLDLVVQVLVGDHGVLDTNNITTATTTTNNNNNDIKNINILIIL